MINGETQPSKQADTKGIIDDYFGTFAKHVEFSQTYFNIGIAPKIHFFDACTDNIQPVQQPNENIILGIDPGTLVMGFAILHHDKVHPKLQEMGILNLKKVSDPYLKLQLIHEKIHELIVNFGPGHFAIEAPFFGKNVQSMLKLGRAQGVAIAAAMHSKIDITEYPPKLVKQTITGNGNATKEQVWQMLRNQLHLREETVSYDATDALGVALCHSIKMKNPLAQFSSHLSKDWKSFLEKNPGRIL